MKPIGVVGHFGGDQPFFDGQTVKTRNFYRALGAVYPEGELLKLDTYGFRKRCISFFCDGVKLICKCKNVVIMPDENGIRVFIPLYGVMNVLLRRKLHYNVIGGWLPRFMEKHKVVRFFAKRFTGIYVETERMKTELEKQGFTNIYVVPNFKFITPVQKNQLETEYTKPYKLCIFSRVMREKGVEDAVNILRELNKEEICYTLDIYGPVDPEQIQWFEELKNNFPAYVRYCGIVPSEQSVETVKNYFALLFPTKFYTEGIPGTIIDAYAAGVPVISAKWESFADVVDDSATGYGYEFDNTEALTQLLSEISENPGEIIGLKENCLQKAQGYLPETAMGIFLQRMEG